MKTSYYWSIIAAILVCLASARSLVGAGADGGTPGYTLSEGLSARALGMGRSFTGIGDDVSALYYNPGGLFQLPKKEVQYMYIKLYEDTAYNSLGYVHVNGSPWTFGAAVTQLKSDGFVSRDEYNRAGASFSDEELSMLLSGCYRINERSGIGINIKSLNKKIETYSGQAIDGDIGMLYKPSRAWSFGIDVQNIRGAQLQRSLVSDTLPRIVRIGGACSIFDNETTLAIDGEISDQRALKMHAGAECRVVDLIALRAGYDIDTITVGLGAKYKDYSVDYALLSRENLDLSHRMSLGLRFGYDRDELKKRQVLAELKKRKRMTTNLADNVSPRPGNMPINVAVLDFYANNVSSQDALMVSDLIRWGLVKKSAFVVVDRKNMELILAEQKVQLSGCTEQDYAVRIGHLLNVNRIVVGSVSKISKKYHVIANVVNIETGEIEFSEEGQTNDANKMIKVCEAIAEKISIEIGSLNTNK